jgi:chitin disaccharide deacetylase
MTTEKSIRLTLLFFMMYSTVVTNTVVGQDNSLSYAARLGWQKEERVVIFHIDDAGMSYESNVGTIQALQFGVATSCSVMMPCPWVPDIAEYLRQNPHVDAGIHLTHTSEWKKYRWASLSGTALCPGLADEAGFLWSSVADVLHQAKITELENEIKFQLSRARKSGFHPTHLDTHMGALWASPEYVNLYQRIGLEEHIPILLPAGHNTLLLQQLDGGPLAGLKKLAPDGDQIRMLQSLRSIGETLWNGGLAVVDDLYILSYDWQLPAGILPTDENIRKFKTERYKSLLRDLKPGITVILIHCADADESFSPISDSWITRRGDLLSMTDPDLKVFIGRQNIVLTTWRELQRRRERNWKKN